MANLDKLEIELEERINRLIDLGFCYDTFITGKEYCSELYSGFDTTNSIWITSALSKMIVIEYSKVFIKNRISKSERNISTKYLTKSEGFNKNLHKSLIEMRKKVSAHADRDFEPKDCSIICTRMENEKPDITKPKSVQFPVQFFLINVAFRKISNKEKVKEILDHFDRCMMLTTSEIQKVAEGIREILLSNPEHSFNNKHLDFESLKKRNNRALDISSDLSKNTESIELNIGGTNVMFTVTRYMHTPDLEIDFQGKDFRLTGTKEGKFNVAFYPKSKVERN